MSSREELCARLATVRRKTERRHQAVLADLAKVENAPSLAYEAELLKTVTQKVKPYDAKVTVRDYATGQDRVVALTPGQPLLKQIASRFREAKRLEGAADKVLARLTVVELHLAKLAELQAQLDATEDAALPGFAATLVGREFQPPKKSGRAPTAAEPELPYRVITASTGRAIWVGRGARRNDELTFKHASPHAAWFHATGFAGAHVVVPKRRDEKLDPVTEREAALLAAHHSKAPDGPLEVTATEVKFVRKPRGAKAGLVAVSRERHVYVDKSAAAVHHLLHRGPDSGEQGS